MKFIIILLLIWLNIISLNLYSQSSSDIKKISDIPHKTVFEKLMWIHRSVALNVTKERKINYDTSYIRSYYKRLVITLPITNRFLKFSLLDSKSGNKLVFAPNPEYNLGISVSSRWASFIVNSRIKIYGSDTEIKGKTSFNDYQLNLYGRKFTTDMFVQYYRGFFIKNSKSYDTYTNEKPYQIRSDVYALHMGVSSYYVVNNKRFSYSNSFAFAEQQKKSAGSLLLGIYYSYFTATGSPSLVSDPFRVSFDSLSLIRSAQTHHFGFNLGYIYTLVILKKFYATASLVQGIGGTHVAYRRDDASAYNKLEGGAGKLHVRFGLGYDHGRYFGGVMGMFDYYLLGRKTTSTFDYSYGKFMIYTGYRFSVLKAERKLLKRLKLIDY